MPATRAAALALATTSAALVAATAVAHAEPSSAEPAPPFGPATYLEAGVVGGFVQDGPFGDLYGALRLDGGHRLQGPLWLHARLAQADVVQIHPLGEGPPGGMTSFTEARLGVEARGCRGDGAICLVGGLDAGYAHVRFNVRPADSLSNVLTGTARLFVDIGGRNLWLRGGVELGVGQASWVNVGPTLGIAYAW